eukprot:gene5087-biopygen8085
MVHMPPPQRVDVDWTTGRGVRPRVPPQQREHRTLLHYPTVGRPSAHGRKASAHVRKASAHGRKALF